MPQHSPHPDLAEAVRASPLDGKPLTPAEQEAILEFARKLVKERVTS